MEPVGETTAGANPLTFPGGTGECNNPGLQSDIDTLSNFVSKCGLVTAYLGFPQPLSSPNSL
jgi:hypothetical protein